MVRSGFDLDSSDENQLRLLEVAVSLEGKTFPRHRYELVKVLIELGVDINRKTQGRCTTALMMAAVHGRNECIELLIRSGAILDKQGPDGVTALIGAAIYGYKNCVELLLKAGAKRNLVNDEGRTAIDLASSQGHMECVNLLRQEATQVLSKPIVIKKKAFTPKYPIAAKRKQTPWVKRIAKPQEQNKIQPPKEKYFVCGKFTRRHVAMLGVATATIATGLIFSIGSAMQSSR